MNICSSPENGNTHVVVPVAVVQECAAKAESAGATAAAMAAANATAPARRPENRVRARPARARSRIGRVADD
jgi:hypothetical protein